MTTKDEAPTWFEYLTNHPIFLETSTSTALYDDDRFDASASKSRRDVDGKSQNKLCIRDSDLIVAVGEEIRITPLHPIKGNLKHKQLYKRLVVPNIEFPVFQIALNPNGKLLAIAGSHRIAVIALPRDGYAKSIGDIVECRGVELGHYYYDEHSSPPIARFKWHPWGESGTTLLVLTVDGVLREYDVSVNPETPHRTHRFLSNHSSSKGFNATRDRAMSFTFGRGKGDWGPLTLFMLTANGDIYGICPYLPQNAAIPSAYLESLAQYVSGKHARLMQHFRENNIQVDLSLIEQQHQYIKTLLKPLTSRRLSVQHPANGLEEVVIRSSKVQDKAPAIQGPFLFQPAPHELEETDGGDATDVLYLGGRETGETSSVGDGLNLIVIAFQDGKLDVCLDVQKIEAKWNDDRNQPIESNSAHQDPPLLVVYETIDTGGGRSSTSPSRPVLQADPTSSYVFYSYHGTGIHSISFQTWVAPLQEAFSAGGKDVEDVLSKRQHSDVCRVLNTYDPSTRAEFPIVGMAVTDGIANPCALLALSSRPSFFIINIEPKHLVKHDGPLLPVFDSVPKPFIPPDDTDRRGTSHGKSKTERHISLLALEPYTPVVPTLKPIQLPSPLPPSISNRTAELTPDVLRLVAKLSENIRLSIEAVVTQTQALLARIGIQEEEQRRQLQEEQRLIISFQTLQDSVNRAHLADRLHYASRRRHELDERIEIIKKDLLRKASPELSAHEQAWFSELAEICRRVRGVVDWDEESLKHRTSIIERNLSVLTQSQVDTDTKGDWKSKFTYTPPRPRTWGTDQITRYVGRLQYLQKQLQVLQSRVTSVKQSL